MSKKKSPSRNRPDEALENLEVPQIRWKIIAQIAAGFLVVWVLAFMAVPYISYWGVGVVGVLTVLAIGFGLYLWRMFRKQSGLVEILKQAGNPEGRKAAIEKLSAKGDAKDAMNALAKSQLVARENPAEAMRILEAIDIKKAPSLTQDEIRANLGLLYLLHNRVKDARALADEIKISKQPQAKAKALYAAVIAESFARTGKAQEAKKLVETYKADDPAYQEVMPVLLRAQVYSFWASKNRGLAQKAMQELAQVDPQMIAAFTQKGTHPEIQKMAKGLFAKSGLMPKQKIRYKM